MDINITIAIGLLTLLPILIGMIPRKEKKDGD